MNYYERHIGDYLKDTAHLSLLEHGVYSRLLDVYYTRESGIPVAQVERLVAARSKDERAALAVVLDEFFTVSDETLLHARCDREIKRYQAKAERNREVGKLGGRPRKTKTQQEPTDNHDGFKQEPTDNPPQSPVTSNQTPKKPPKSPKGESVGFSEWYAAYPKKQARPSAARAFAKVTTPLPVLLAALEWQRTQQAWTKDGGKWIPLPATYLNDERWTDERSIEIRSITVPGSTEPDPALVKLDRDRTTTKPPSLETRALMAELRRAHA